MSHDSLNFTVLFILPFSESLKWKSPFLPLSAGFHQREIEYPSQSIRLSDLHSVEGCHSLEVSFTEIYTFLFYKPGSFLINPLSLTNTFYLEWKTNSHLVFLIQKKIWKELAWHRSLRISSLATFQAFFAFAHSSISAYSWRLKDNTSFSESKKPIVIYSLSIYFSSIQHRGESIVYHWEWKGSVRYSDAD